MDEVEAAPEPGAAELLTLAVSDTLKLDVEMVRDAEEQSPRAQLKQSASLTNEQQSGKLDDEYIAEMKNRKTVYETRILKLQESIDEINASIRNINSRISIAEKAANHLKNLQPYLNIDENSFLGVVLDPAAFIEINRLELRKFIDKLENSLKEEKTRRDKLEDSLKEEKVRLEDSRDKLEDSLKEEKVRLDKEKENNKRQKVESSDVWMKDLEEKVVEIPEDFDRLRAFLEQELRVKIPCSQLLSSWTSARDPKEQCVEVCRKLFVAFDGDLSPETFRMVYNDLEPVMSQSTGATENTYHLVWDSLIAGVLMKVSHGCYLRDSNQSTSTGLNRPDLCFYYKKLNICVFRGEEKADGEINVPLTELHKKLDAWIYDDAPYLLGYAAVGLQVELATIQKGEGGKVMVQMVEHYDLESLNGRLRLFLAVLNLSTLFQPIVNKIKKRFACREYGVLKKENGVEIQFGTVNVIKKYPSEMPAPLARSLIEHLKRVHGLMSYRAVPNVIQLVSANTSKKTVCLTPIGYPEGPSDLKELVIALLDVLNALVPMHEMMIIHRDLRWDNILRYTAGGQKWFTIDFDDSAQIDGRDWIFGQAKELDPASHAPELHDSTHDEKVDIWSIGYLIRTSHINLTNELIQIKNQCMHADPKKRPTALSLKRQLENLLKTYIDLVSRAIVG